MLKSILIAAMVLLMSCAEDSPQSPTINHAKKSFSLELSAENISLKSGEVPEFVLKMQNNTDSNLVLPLFLDGSMSQERFPHAYFMVNGKPPEGYKLIKSDSKDLVPLSPTNFITLRPGEIYYPDMYLLRNSLQEPLATEGNYAINFVYCLESHDIKDWGYLEANEYERATMLRMFDKVPKETFISNAVEITVTKNESI